MNKKENRRSARQAAQQAVRRDEHNRRIQHAAVAPGKEIPAQTAGGGVRQSLYRYPALPGVGVYHDGHGISNSLPLR